MFVTLDSLSNDARYDLVVIGTGAAGMAAALFAAIREQKVLLVESTEYVGGTTALSAATTWIPNTHHAASVNPEDSRDNAEKFLDGIVGNRSSASLRGAFLDSSPEAVRVLEASSDVKFRPFAAHPDYEQQYAGATISGRALEPLPFDGRVLGPDLRRIRPPIPEFTVFGGMMVDRTDINHLLNFRKSWRSFSYGARILSRYAIDRLSGPRGSRLVMGNALIGRFLFSLQKRGADILTEVKTEGFLVEDGAVRGVILNAGGASRGVRASKGVVLAAGGFSHHSMRRAALLPKQGPIHCPSAPGHAGEMQDLAIALGARLGENNIDNALWAPVSIRRRPDGSTAAFPHFVLDRSKPGTVCVDQSGRRFVNESCSYHQFVRAMFERDRTSPCIPCFIVTDAAGLKKYGLGMVRMTTRDLTPYLTDGYLVEAPTVADLARKIGVDALPLEKTVAAMNSYAKTGRDPEFGRGTTPYHRINGDSSVGPNPTLGPIATAPFYAVRLYPGDIGAATGLVTNEWAQVTRADGSPIAGLYACGNEANSIMGGTYPGPGITIGPAIVFGYRAIQHALGKAEVSMRNHQADEEER